MFSFAHDLDEGLPPDNATFAELLKWLWERLGRRPTMEEMARLRAAMWLRSKRRALRRLAPVRRRADGGFPSAQEIIREMLTGPEGQLILACLAALVFTLASRCRDSIECEYYTRPDVVLRLGKQILAAPKPIAFAPSVRRQMKALAAYISWKLELKEYGDGWRDGLPRDFDTLQPGLLAWVNAQTPEAAAKMLHEVVAAGYESAARVLLKRWTAAGDEFVSSWRGVAWVTPDAPYGLVQPEPAEHGDTPRPDDDDESGGRYRPRLPSS